MPLEIRRLQVWSGEIANLLGAAAAKLDHLTRAGVRLDVVFSRPHPTQADRGVLCLAPITGPEQMQAARDAGLGPALDVALLHIHGENRPGLALELMGRLAVAGISLRVLSVNAEGRNFDAHLGFDSADSAALAVQVLATLEG